jgi:hypothetical protein
MVDTLKAHYLKPNAANERPTHHLFFDVESTVTPQPGGESTHQLRLGWAGYWQARKCDPDTPVAYTHFTTDAAFWDIVDDHCYRKSTLVLVAHNIGYDFGVLHGFAELELRGWKLTRVYMKGMTNLLTFKAPGRTLKLIDNGCWFHGSLAALGDAIGLPKLEVDYDTQDTALLSTYCRRDVEIMVKAWQSLYHFLDEHNLGNWGPTVASQAFNAFRHRFMRHKILIKQAPETLKLERATYKGGRVSCFRVGDFSGQTLYKVDVNSMYPAMMSQHQAPYQPVGHPNMTSVTGLQETLRRYAVVADVQVTTTEPVFPVRHKTHNVYPVGTFRTILCTPELSYALDRDWVKQVFAVQRYKQNVIFKEYVDFFYALKQHYTETGNTPFRFMTKLYLNSLYGKFGQRSTEWTEQKDLPPELQKCSTIYNTVTGRTSVLYRLGSAWWTEQDTGEGVNAFPAVSAHVTAYARMRLWDLIKQAGRDNVYYCDTDSLIVTPLGLENLQSEMHPLNLGALKLEGTSTDTVIQCPKVYHFHGNWVRKGVPSKAMEVAPQTFDATQFPSIRGLGTKPEEPFYTTRITRKYLKNMIYDGTPGPEGWVSPFLAQHLIVKHVLTTDEEREIESLEARIDALHSSRVISHQTIFSLWDYRKNTWKTQWDKRGNRVPGHLAHVDELAQELGFSSTDALESAVQKQLATDSQIRNLTAQLRNLTA